MAPSIIVDSAASEIAYVGSQWQPGADPSTFSGTYNSCRTDLNTATDFPTMIFSFQGTGISFYGQPSDDLQMNYTYDDSRLRPIDADFTRGITGKTGVRIWGAENVTSGIHTITLVPTKGQPIFDYIVVTPDASTYLGSKILALDDTDSSIQYKGNWQSQSGTTFPAGLSFQNTRRGTSTPGDSFTVPFTGASISVFGLLNQQAGNLSSTYAIDGGTPTAYIAYNGTQISEPDTWRLHEKFFAKDVVPGDHNLTVTVGNVSGSQIFWLDYILFEGISTTKLYPAPPSKPKSGGFPDKAIIGLIAAFFGLLYIYYRLEKKFGKRFESWWNWWKQSDSNHHNNSDFQFTEPTPIPIIPIQANVREVDRLQVERDNLERENERIRRFREQQVQPPQRSPVDAGPVEAPPPYSSMAQ